MGTDFAIVHDPTREAYELIRSDWRSWRSALPSSIDAVRERLVAMYPTDPPCADWSDLAATEVWDFIQKHPGCRIVDDVNDDAHWTKTPREPEDYLQIGSMYDLGSSS